ncbi:rRNA methyltransferase [Clostridium polyendosporum]|uniref:rRNA methyltransferase n=1 Tax=Clostridium polyendosporum TaxID=69208 RepID=A0A919S0S1_9CLOT|nr:class I SAM-dependent methyltransferase [Clostridium polyendosporum]GIM29754.1 rRNA methyltransferase [Clostridium polyendosporum]
MFKYVSDVSTISHHLIDSFVYNKDIAIDATLGNGYDADFLSVKFNKVYAFDIQKCAIDNYESKCKPNVKVIYDSHESFEKYIPEEVDCIMYNLGFLPGNNKEITTKAETTVNSLKTAIKILRKGGIITIALYSGHEEGKKELAEVLDYVKVLPKNEFAVLYHQFLNRQSTAPSLVVIEKK